MAFKLFAANMKVLEREQRLERAEFIADTGSWEYDAKKKILTASEGAKRIYGLSGNEIPVDEIKKAILPEYLSSRDAAWRGFLRQGLPFDIEYEILRPTDGKRLYIHSMAKFDSERNVASGTIQDITEHKRKEEAVRESERNYHDIFDNAMEGIFRTTIEGKCIQANRAMAAMLGYDSPEELIHSITDSTNQIWLNSGDRQAFTSLLEKQGSVSNFQGQFKRKDGAGIWVSFSSRIIRNAHGKSLYYESFFQDITVRKHAEELIHENEKKYQQLFSEMTLGCALQEIVCNELGEAMDYKTLEVNAAFERILNVDRNAVVGRLASAILPAEELKKWLDVFGPVASGGGSRAYEQYSPLNDKYFEGVVFSPEPGRFAVAFNDVTENRKLEASLKRSHTLLNDMSEMTKTGAWEYDVEREELHWTEEMYRIYEVDSSFVPTIENVKQFIAPESLQASLRATQRLMEQGEPYDIELELTTGKGTRKRIRIMGKAEYANGNIVRRLGITQDITDLKEAADALRKSEFKYRSLIEYSSDIVFCVDQRGEYQFVNKVFASAFDRDVGYFIGKTFWDMYPKEHADHRYEIIKRVFRTGEKESF
jgi:PAS domain S-box-containing protein